MDTDEPQYWEDLEQQAALLHERLRELFESKPVRFLTDPLKIPNTPEAKLAQYLHLLQTRHPLFALDKSKQGKMRRDRALQNFCIQRKQFPESYFDNWIKRKNEEGIGVISLSEKQRKVLMDSINTDQLKRLKQWVKHLNGDSGYPIWFRYFVLSNIVKLKEFDTKNAKFPRRSKSSTANFPELNPAVVRDIYRHITDPEFHQEKKRALAKQYFHMETRDSHSELPESDSNFAKLYEFWTHDFLRRVTSDDLDKTEGQWRHFDGPHLTNELTKSISGYNTGWCTANMGQSSMFLTHGEIWVYYTPLATGEIVVPRISISLDGNRVREVRGIANNQSIEDQLLEVTHAKLKELPGGSIYFRTVDDTRTLTEIVNKIKDGEVLSRQDLSILYEIEKPLKSFGMRRDPRIANAISTRDMRNDLAFLFGCEPEEVALYPGQLNSDTVVCVFDVNRKTELALDQYPNVFAIVGDANFERMSNRFPNVAFVSGNAVPGGYMDKLTIVGGTLSYTNSRRSLENLTKVGGSALLSSTHCEFPALERVGESLTLNYSSSTFPSLKYVGGRASFEGARIDWLPEDLVIAGSINGNYPTKKVPFTQNPLVL